MPVPTIYPTMLFDKLDEFLLEFEEHDEEIFAGVASVGPAAAYAEVWEWGNIRQTKQGPKTVQGTNPAGEIVWLSLQAPFGYIKINENRMWEALKQELGKVKFKSTNAREMTEELQEAARKAMERCAKFLEESAPVDTGALQSSFEVIEDGDPLLDESDDTKVLLIGAEEE